MTLKNILLAILGFGILAIVFTFPLIMHFSTHTLGQGHDSSMFIWGLWHLKKSLLSMQNPYFSTMLYYPITANLLIHTWVPLKCFLVLPLLTFMKPIAVYNTMVVGTLIANAVGMYVLVYSYTKDKQVSVFGGVIFAFAPFQMAHSMGHLNIISVEAIPWMLLLWRKWINQTKFWHTVVLGVLGAYQFLADYQIFIFLCVLILLYLIHSFARERRQFNFIGKHLLKIVLVTLMLLSPYIVLLVRYISDFNILQLDIHPWAASILHSIDLLSLLIPSELHPLWGQLAQKLYNTLELAGSDVFLTKKMLDIGWTVPTPIHGAYAERTIFFGYSILLILGYGVFKYWKVASIRKWFWIGLFFFIMALGPILRIKGIGINHIPGFSLMSFDGLKLIFPMPYVINHYLPIINGIRVPSRFILFTLLAVALLVPLVLKHFFEAGKIKPTLKNGIIIGLLGVVLLEYFPAPNILQAYPSNRVYTIIEEDKNTDHVVLDMPCVPWEHNLQSMYYQTIHGHKIIGGFTARMSKQQVLYKEKYNILYAITLSDRVLNIKKMNEILQELNITYIITRNSLLGERMRLLSANNKLLQSIVDPRENQGIGLWEVIKSF